MLPPDCFANAATGFGKVAFVRTTVADPERANLFNAEYQYLWAAVLALALFLPVHRLISILMVRRAERSQKTTETECRRLRLRAGATAILLCFVFSLLYTATLFETVP